MKRKKSKWQKPSLIIKFFDWNSTPFFVSGAGTSAACHETICLFEEVCSAREDCSNLFNCPIEGQCVDVGCSRAPCGILITGCKEQILGSSLG